ncbi:MAG: SRPBCC domain-containing protein [Myxococcota bacterium]
MTTSTTRNVRVSFVVPASPDDVYGAWLDSSAHAAMTGGQRAEIEPRTFGRHMAGDGYIEGVILELDTGRRIVQTWRSSEFQKSSPDSRLEVHFGHASGGTRVGIEHEDVPVELADDIEAGWTKFYAEPMRAYFSQQGKRTKVKSPMAKAKSAGKAVKAKAAKAGKKVAKVAKAAVKKAKAAVKKARGKTKVKATAKKKAKPAKKAKPKKVAKARGGKSKKKARKR